MHSHLLIGSKRFVLQLGGSTASHEICFTFPQPKKAEEPMSVTLLPMVTEARALHQEKALSLIVVTLLGMITEVREENQRKH